MFDLNNKTFNNIVSPTVSGEEAVDFNAVNINTYNNLSPLFKALIVSTNNGGKYALKVIDKDKGFYFNYREGGLSIKVPLTAIFNTNDKIRGILGVAFSSAKFCPSRSRGLCQLDSPELCYAYTGERQGSKKSYNYLMGMGSYLNALLSEYYFKLFYQDAEVRHTFYRYCNYYNIDTLRFNLKGDFKDTADIRCIEYMADMGLNLTGYTARDDLRPYLLDMINKHDNIILNGSNIMYTNQFRAVNSILEYLTAENQCLGGCLKNGCLNCYKLHDALITVLIHGKEAGVDLKTADNIHFLTWLFKQAELPITTADFKSGKNLFNNIKNAFKKHDLYAEVPDYFLKLTKKGNIVFDSQSAIIQYLRHLIRTNNINLNQYRGINNE